jgi:hypothetical protein
LRMQARSATDVPPNFMTKRPMACLSRGPRAPRPGWC